MLSYSYVCVCVFFNNDLLWLSLLVALWNSFSIGGVTVLCKYA